MLSLTFALVGQDGGWVGVTASSLACMQRQHAAASTTQPQWACRPAVGSTMAARVDRCWNGGGGAGGMAAGGLQRWHLLAGRGRLAAAVACAVPVGSLRDTVRPWVVVCLLCHLLACVVVYAP